MARKNLFSNTGTTVQKKALEYKNSFVQLAVVQNVDTGTGKMNLKLSSDKLISDIPYFSNVQATGNVDIAVPLPGDIVYIYQDAVIHGMHLGPAPRDYEFLIQDKSVENSIQSTDPLSIPHIYPGERYIRSAKGASLQLTDNLTLADALNNSITIDSNEDQIETYSGTLKSNLFVSEMHVGLTKRFNVPSTSFPNFHPLYDSIIYNPDSTSNDPMSEFTVYLGKSLVNELDDAASYLNGSNEDPNADTFDFTIGKEDTPKITFSLSDTAVTDINGETFPTFQNAKLNMLLQIADVFSLMVNQEGSILMGKVSANAVTGITMNTTPGAESMTMGLRVGNNIFFQSLGGILVQTPNIGGSSDTVNARLQLYANSSLQLANNVFNLFVNSDPANTYMSMSFSNGTPMSMRADKDGFTLVAGESFWVFKSDGTVQLNQKTINIGQPNITKLKPYETAMLGNTTTNLLREILEILGAVTGNLAVPLLGAAAYPPNMATSIAEISTKLGLMSATYGISVSPAVGPIIPGVISPATGLLSSQVNIGS